MFASPYQQLLLSLVHTYWYLVFFDNLSAKSVWQGCHWLTMDVFLYYQQVWAEKLQRTFRRSQTWFYQLFFRFVRANVWQQSSSPVRHKMERPPIKWKILYSNYINQAITSLGKTARVRAICRGHHADSPGDEVRYVSMRAFELLYLNVRTRLMRKIIKTQLLARLLR